MNHGLSERPEYLSLRKWNLGLGLLHLLQGLIMLFVSNDTALPIETRFLEFTGSGVEPVSQVLFQLPIGAAVSAFLFMSAIAHFSMASPWIYPWYAEKLSERINYIRWIEYSISASWMLIVIAMLCGIFDVGTLILIFGSCMAMNLCGMLMEMRNQGRDDVDWTPFTVGCVAGLLPWVVIVLYFVGAVANSSTNVPGFVYLIVVSLFVFFNLFPINMVLQYKGWGRWKDYLYGERGYMIMSLVAKSLLAWQVWAGTLRPM